MRPYFGYFYGRNHAFIATEHRPHIWPGICSFCSNHNTVLLSSLMTYYQIFSNSNMMCSLVEPELHTFHPRVHDVQSLICLLQCFVVHCLYFCPDSFCHCIVSRSSISKLDYPFCIFKVVGQNKRIRKTKK